MLTELLANAFELTSQFNRRSAFPQPCRLLACDHGAGMSQGIPPSQPKGLFINDPLQKSGNGSKDPLPKKW